MGPYRGVLFHWTMTNHAEAQADIADYIVGFYNPIRLHSTLGYQSPNSYEMHQAFAAHSA